MKILIVEDEKQLLITLKNYLSKNNYISEVAENYRKAECKVAVYDYDIIILDITLPDGNGLDLLKILKKKNINTGVIIISAKNSLDDKIKGLDIGADDYLTKPFELPELNARIKALLRRRKFHGTNIIKFNEINIDTESRTVRIFDKELKLTRKEYDMLLFFIMNKGRILTKESIAEHLWNDNIDLVDNFDFIYTHLNNLRKKIKEKGGHDYIKTIYGVGYKFDD